MSYAAFVLFNAALFAVMPLLLRLYRVSEEAGRLALILILIHNLCGILLWTPSFVTPNAMKAAGEDYEELGIMGEVHPDAAAAFGLEGVRVYCCELMFGAIERKANTEIVYEPLPKYPSTSRDIALLVDEAMEVGNIEDVIRQKGGQILESVRLFDVYRGKQVEDGKKSVAFTLVYRDRNKTLTDKEVSDVHENVLQTLKEKLNAVLRDM